MRRHSKNHCAIVNVLRIVTLLRRSPFSMAGSFGKVRCQMTQKQAEYGFGEYGFKHQTQWVRYHMKTRQIGSIPPIRSRKGTARWGGISHWAAKLKRGDFVQFFRMLCPISIGDGPSTVSDREYVRLQTPNLVIFFGPHRVPGGRAQWVPLGLLFVCQGELTEFFAELTEFAAELSEFSPPKQYSRNSIPPVS